MVSSFTAKPKLTVVGAMLAGKVVRFYEPGDILWRSTLVLVVSLS